MTAEEQEKFFREARAAAQLRHPSIVSVHEVGRDGDSVYIVSDFVRGVTLGDWLSGQKLTSREAAELCAKIADALHHAHEQGVVHRDLKPANVMIDDDGQPHLMDFGLARREVGEVTVTIDGQVLGTPAYMSPEQAQGEAHKADRRSDVYSLGVILFQLLTGELPFRGNARMIMHQVINDEPPTPRNLNSTVPRDLETITLKCLEKDPVRRYLSAHEVAADLRRFLAGESILARPASHVERMMKWRHRNRTIVWAWEAVALALLSATIVSTYFVFEARRQTAIATSRQKQTESALEAAESARKDVAASLEAAAAGRKAAELAQAEEKKSREEAEEWASYFARLGATSVGQNILPDWEKSLVRLKDRLGNEHQLTVMTMAVIARLYRDGGRVDEAIPLLESSVEALRRVTRAGDQFVAVRPFSVATSGWAGRREWVSADAQLTLLRLLQELGSSYREAGRTRDAIPLLEEAVVGLWEKTGFLATSGYKNVEARIALEQLASVYSDAALPEKANAFFKEQVVPRVEKELAAQGQKIGADYPERLKQFQEIDRNYAHVFGDAANAFFNEKSILLLEEALAAQRDKLGADHADTLVSMDTLANAYQEAGRPAEAIRLYEELFAARRDKLGADHADTISTMRSLTITYHSAGQLDKSTQLLQQMLNDDLYFQSLGVANVVGADALIDAAKTESADQVQNTLDAVVVGELKLIAGDYESAERALRSAIARGNTNPYAYKSLGWCLRAQGKNADAKEAFERVLESRRSESGKYNLNSADSAHMTAAYSLDVIAEEQYAAHFAGDNRMACFPWLYIGQRREFEGNTQAAIAAYQKCNELGNHKTAHSNVALARYRLARLRETAKP
jgi:tetratricopeptide (TPR) repeat protein